MKRERAGEHPHRDQTERATRRGFWPFRRRRGAEVAEASVPMGHVEDLAAVLADW